MIKRLKKLSGEGQKKLNATFRARSYVMFFMLLHSPYLTVFFLILSQNTTIIYTF